MPEILDMNSIVAVGWFLDRELRWSSFRVLHELRRLRELRYSRSVALSNSLGRHAEFVAFVCGAEFVSSSLTRSLARGVDGC